MRSLALFTGGLDSLLAVRLVQAHGVDVVGLHVATSVCAADRELATSAAAQLGIELLTADLDDEYCQLVRRPRFSRVLGSAPCVDCRIAVFSRARAMLSGAGASFVVSGEVVGQRPRSAIRDLEVLAHHSGLGELLVRPLSARLLPPTLPETNGWLDRTRLLEFHGKRRKPQQRLASNLGLEVLPEPRPECPLLDKALGARVRELAGLSPQVDAADLTLATFGRHFRLSDETLVVVGHNQLENERLVEHFQRRSDRLTLLRPRGFVGPSALVVGPCTAEQGDMAARLVVRFGRPHPGAPAQVLAEGQGREQLWEVSPASDEPPAKAEDSP